MNATESTKVLHWWAHSSPAAELKHGKKDEAARLRDSLHMLRDGPPCLLIYALLADSHSLGRILLNLPEGVYAETGPPLEEYPEIPPQDLLLLTTRPALDDDPIEKRWIARTGSEIEVMVHAGLRRFLKWCSRTMVILSDEVAERIERADQLAYRAIRFRLVKDAHCIARGNFENVRQLEAAQRQAEYRVEESYATNGYVAYLPELQTTDGCQGPGLLSAFGMNGTGTLLWAHLLFTEQPALVRDLIRGDKPRLLVGEFEARFPKGIRPASISFSATQNLRIVLDVELD